MACQQPTAVPLSTRLTRLATPTLSKRDDIMDKRFGFPKYTEGPERLGWCINMQPVRGHASPQRFK